MKSCFVFSGFFKKRKEPHMDTKKYLELCERAETGEKVSKDDWDMDYIIDTVMELVDEYDFDWTNRCWCLRTTSCWMICLQRRRK